ncbi:MAG: M23 family metallopeptidase [Gemmatimonadota bacterium]
MRDGHLTFLIVPEDESNVRRIRLSYRTLRWLGVLIGALGLLVLIGLGTYGGMVGRTGRLAVLERENRRLEAERGKVGEIVENLERSERTYQQIRSLAGLENLPSPAAAIAVPVVDEGTADEAVPAGPAILDERPAEERPGDTPPGEPTPAEERPARVPPPDERPSEALTVEDATPSGWPLAVKGFVTARFEGQDGHTGVDIAVPRETPVLATAPGRVTETGFDSILGHYVVMAHEGGLETLYAHNARLLVERGQRVERAEAVAYSGNSGRSTAPHLHYEIRKAGRAVDPDPYLH